MSIELLLGDEAIALGLVEAGCRGATAYTGVVGGFLVIPADDPGPHSSQTEQDSRLMALNAKVPVFDPSTPAEARLMVERAFALSEQLGLPVMLRPTTRLCHALQSMQGAADFGPDPPMPQAR